ncbi:hypothetical protein BH11ACT3_BH11ACT3_05160 [soil metagenome]
MPVPTADRSATGSPNPSASAIDGDRLGDVVSTTPVTDELGDYRHVTIAPDAAAFASIDQATVDASIAGSDWDDTELLDAQRFVATFVAEQAIDSVALDRDEAGWKQWLTEVAPTYFADPLPDALAVPEDNTDRAIPIFNDADDATPILVRDGGARLTEASITIDELANSPREGGEWLAVIGSAQVSYRVSDDSALAALMRQGYTEQEARESFPVLTDGVDGAYLGDFTFEYDVDRIDGKWVIRDWSLTSDTSFEGVNEA